MNEQDAIGLALRLALGVVMLAHGWNHLRGPGGVAGTARWFASMGLTPPRVHALVSGTIEVAAGGALIVGLATPLACAAVVGIMTVAFAVAHRTNGFFIFKEGWEYVAVLAVVAVCLAALGPGRWSLDELAGTVVSGGSGALLSAGLGLAGALGLLLTSWRPVVAKEPVP